VAWFDGGDGFVSESVVEEGNPGDVSTTWVERGGIVQRRGGAVTARVRLRLETASGWVTFDDVSLTELGGEMAAAMTPVTFASEVAPDGVVEPEAVVGDGDTRLGVLTAGDGGPVVTETVYYQFDGSLVAMRRDGELYYLLSDQLGSTSVPTDVGFTGQRLDTSTGLMFYQARYYDPTIGRFISADSIVPDPANPQDLNRYSYVGNNPVTFTDPTGHFLTASDDERYPGDYAYSIRSAGRFGGGGGLSGGGGSSWDEDEYTDDSGGPDRELLIAAMLEVIGESGYSTTGYAGLVREVVDDVSRWAAPPSDVVFTIDTSRLPVIEGFDEKVLGKLATKVRNAGAAARWVGVGFAFVTDVGDYQSGYKEAGWSGAFWELGETTSGVGGGLVTSGLVGGGTALACGALSLPGCAAAAIVVGFGSFFLGQWGGRGIYARLVDRPPGLLEDR